MYHKCKCNPGFSVINWRKKLNFELTKWQFLGSIFNRVHSPLNYLDYLDLYGFQLKYNVI